MSISITKARESSDVLEATRGRVFVTRIDIWSYDKVTKRLCWWVCFSEVRDAGEKLRVIAWTLDRSWASRWGPWILSFLHGLAFGCRLARRTYRISHPKGQCGAFPISYDPRETCAPTQAHEVEMRRASLRLEVVASRFAFLLCLNVQIDSTPPSIAY